MDFLSFNHSQSLLWLALPLIGGLATLLKRPAEATLPSLRLLSAGRPVRRHREWLTVAAMVCLALSLAEPSLNLLHGHAPLSIAITMDLSGSMEARDSLGETTPNPPDGLLAPRLERARDIARRMLQEHRTDYALIAFARRAYLASPLTRDEGLLQERLADLECLAFEDGTAIGEAILCALRSLKNAPASAILLLSDGVDHADSQSLRSALNVAQQQGISVLVCPIGNTRPWHQIIDENGRSTWKQMGEPADVATLQNIATATGGTLCRSADELLAQLRTLAATTPPARQTISLVSWLYLLALLLLLSSALPFPIGRFSRHD
ncbi:MAG: VWA domain-containing protein [Victivallales bacterium]|nr:VWA domain-containing protein [Victivallales bacterium]